MLACVGLDLAVRGYPAGRGVRDDAQLALIERIRLVVASSWVWRTEVPIPIAGDPRAWDVVLRGPGGAIGVEAETRLRDIQAVDRRVMLKLRDSGLDRAIILVAGTRTNRSTLRAVGSGLLANYPVSSRQALDALATGRDPGGNAIVVLARSRLSPHRARLARATDVGRCASMTRSSLVGPCPARLIGWLHGLARLGWPNSNLVAPKTSQLSSVDPD